MRWDPLQEIVSWHERRYGAAGRGSGWSPPVDVYETAESYVVVLELAGLSSEDFDIQATDESLTIRGRRGGDAGEGRFLHVERGYGEFTRAFAFAERIRARGDLRRVPGRPADRHLAKTARRRASAHHRRRVTGVDVVPASSVSTYRCSRTAVAAPTADPPRALLPGVLDAARRRRDTIRRFGRPLYRPVLRPY